MKMCLKLAYGYENHTHSARYAFSSSPSKDAMMSTFCGFSSLSVEVKPFDEFFPSQNMIANLSLCVHVSISLYGCVCVYVHPLNKDGSQAMTDTFFKCILQKMEGWVTLRFVFALC